MPTRRKGTLGGKAVFLADVDDAYRRRYVAVFPQTQDIPGETDEFSADELTRELVQDDWSGGENQDGSWSSSRPSVYHRSNNVRPLRVGDGIELGAAQDIPQDDAPADFTEGEHLGVGLGSLWAVKDGSAADWQPSTENWNSTTISTGAVANAVASIADGDDTFMYSSHANKTIWRWKTGTTTNWVTGAATQPSYVPVMVSFQGTLYALDGDDLYTIDKTSGAGAWSAVATQVSDTTVAGSSAVYLADTASYLRLSKSDVGPIWLQRLDNGQTLIHEYNHFTQTTRTVGKIPYDQIFPYDINFFLGFVFVTFRFASAHSLGGDAYMFYKRGAQQGLIGPFRSTTGVTGSKNILIGGMIGNDVMVYYDGAVWAYDLNSGGVSMLATQTTTTNPARVRTFGKEVFLSGVEDSGNTSQVERLDTTAYTTETDASLDTGRWNFGFPRVKKILLDITVITDPLPAGPTLGVAYSVNGGAFATHATTSGTDGATVHTFTVSDNSASVVGEDFNIRVLPKNIVTNSTVTIREVTARVASAQKYIEWRLQLDMKGTGGAREGSPRDARLTIPELNGQIVSNAVQAFSDPWQVPEGTAAESFDVWVLPSETPELYPPAGQDQVAGVRLRTVSPQ